METQAITVSQHVDAAPPRVWQALTDPALLAQWWAAGDLQPVVGHRFTLDMGAFGMQQCEVREVEPEQKISYTFGEGFIDTTVTWTLEAEGTGTRVTMEHSGFDLDSPMGGRAYQGMKAGWPAVLARIEPTLLEAAE